MRSSSGQHFIALDHVRALAAFMVFTWHFTHDAIGYPVPFDYSPAIIPLSVLDEGHTGVALFMTLSGYLFSKLLDGKSIRYGAFLWNRILRLIPLLLVVSIVAGIQAVSHGYPVSGYIHSLVYGVFLPTLPNGGWSITVEFHFYVILPLLLWMLTKSKLLLLLVVVIFIALRIAIFQVQGEVQSLAYWTIVGRIDQFTLGMLAYRLRDFIANRHVMSASIIAMFICFYWYFDLQGGYFIYNRSPSLNWLWTILPTIEGFAYAVGITYYDNSFVHSASGVSKFVGLIGKYSYSIYLLHFFVVFRVARLIHEKVMDISDFYAALLWSMAVFVLMTIPGYLSFRFIESPFLNLRKSYLY